jgi:hypothetical protein
LKPIQLAEKNQPIQWMYLYINLLAGKKLSFKLIYIIISLGII